MMFSLLIITILSDLNDGSPAYFLPSHYWPHYTSIRWKRYINVTWYNSWQRTRLKGMKNLKTETVLEHLIDIHKNSEHLKRMIRRNFSSYYLADASADQSLVKAIIGTIHCCFTLVSKIKNKIMWEFETGSTFKINVTFQEVNLVHMRKGYFNKVTNHLGRRFLDELNFELVYVNRDLHRHGFKYDSPFVSFLMGKRNIFNMISNYGWLVITLMYFPATNTKLKLIFSVIEYHEVQLSVNNFYINDAEIVSGPGQLKFKHFCHHVNLGDEARSQMRSYFIAVGKLERLRIKFKYNRTNIMKKFYLYDGPDDESPLIKTINSHQIHTMGFVEGGAILSTFHGYLKYYAIVPFFYVEIYSIMQSNTQVIDVSSNVKLNFSSCYKKYSFKYHCIINLTTPINYINISLTSMIYDGPNIMNCYFGGVSYLEYHMTEVFPVEFTGTPLLVEKYVERKTFCDSYTKNPRYNSFDKIPMDFITTSSHVLIVIYGHSPYNREMDVNFSITLTKCKGLIPCHYGKFSDIFDLLSICYKTCLSLFIFTFIQCYH